MIRSNKVAYGWTGMNKRALEEYFDFQMDLGKKGNSKPEIVNLEPGFVHLRGNFFTAIFFSGRERN